MFELMFSWWFSGWKRRRHCKENAEEKWIRSQHWI